MARLYFSTLDKENINFLSTVVGIITGFELCLTNKYSLNCKRLIKRSKSSSLCLLNLNLNSLVPHNSYSWQNELILNIFFILLLIFYLKYPFAPVDTLKPH